MEATASKITREEMFKDERVILRYIPNFSNGITEKTHPEYGGLSNNSRIGICAPVLTGRINEIFSDAELEILAKELNEPTMIHKTSDFWKEYVTDKHGMSTSIFPIFIKKEGAMYNKKNPIDYIYIKILRDSEIIGNSIKNAKEIGAKFALLEERDQFKKEKDDISTAKKAFKYYYKYEDNEPALRYLLSNTNKTPGASVDLDFLQTEAWKEMQERPTMFSKILGDEFLDTKIKITEFLKHKLISKSNNLYYMEKGEAIALDGEINDIDGAARYFASGIGQEKLLTYQARLDTIKK
jgi:hypothetical protein